MPKKKKYYWTRAEEAELIELWKKGITTYDVLAKELDRTLGAVQKKGAVVVVCCCGDDDNCASQGLTNA